MWLLQQLGRQGQSGGGCVCDHLQAMPTEEEWAWHTIELRRRGLYVWIAEMKPHNFQRHVETDDSAFLSQHQPRSLQRLVSLSCAISPSDSETTLARETRLIQSSLPISLAARHRGSVSVETPAPVRRADTGRMLYGFSSGDMHHWSCRTEVKGRLCPLS